jgi:hypothetical protein
MDLQSCFKSVFFHNSRRGNHPELEGPTPVISLDRLVLTLSPSLLTSMVSKQFSTVSVWEEGETAGNGDNRVGSCLHTAWPTRSHQITESWVHTVAGYACARVWVLVCASRSFILVHECTVWGKWRSLYFQKNPMVNSRIRVHLNCMVNSKLCGWKQRHLHFM